MYLTILLHTVPSAVPPLLRAFRQSLSYAWTTMPAMFYVRRAQFAIERILRARTLHRHMGRVDRASSVPCALCIVHGLTTNTYMYPTRLSSVQCSMRVCCLCRVMGPLAYEGPSHVIVVRRVDLAVYLLVDHVCLSPSMYQTPEHPECAEFVRTST